MHIFLHIYIEIYLKTYLKIYLAIPIFDSVTSSMVCMCTPQLMDAIDIDAMYMLQCYCYCCIYEQGGSHIHHR